MPFPSPPHQHHYSDAVSLIHTSGACDNATPPQRGAGKEGEDAAGEEDGGAWQDMASGRQRPDGKTAHNATWTPWVWASTVEGLGQGVEPFALQLVLGKTLTELSSDALAGHIMSSMRVGERARVSGRLQAQDDEAVAAPRSDQIDLVVYEYQRISRGHQNPRASSASTASAASSTRTPSSSRASSPARKRPGLAPETGRQGEGEGEGPYLSELDPRRILLVRDAEQLRVAVQALLLSLGRSRSACVCTCVCPCLPAHVPVSLCQSGVFIPLGSCSHADCLLLLHSVCTCLLLTSLAPSKSTARR